jgi:hypothetical protein
MNALVHWKRLMSESDLGDFTPSNVVLSEDHWREIVVAIPNVQVFVGVRNPSRRVWSALRMLERNGILDGNISPEEVLEFVDLPGQAERSFVSRTIQHLHGAQANVFAFSLDEVASDSALLYRISDFVGVQVSAQPPINVGAPRAMPPTVAAALDARFAEELGWLEETVRRKLRL